jgi:hypothetical protein
MIGIGSRRDPALTSAVDVVDACLRGDTPRSGWMAPYDCFAAMKLTAHHSCLPPRSVRIRSLAGSSAPPRARLTPPLSRAGLGTSRASSLGPLQRPVLRRQSALAIA